MTTRQATGQLGEQMAAEHLQDNGLVILARNWRTAAGELDIVAFDGTCLVAVEVKTRRSVRCGFPLEAVTPEKASRLRRLLAQFVMDFQVHASGLRVDVVTVLLPAGRTPEIGHLRGVC